MNNEWEKMLRLWYKNSYPGEPSKKELDWIISFISDLLQSHNQELIEVIEGKYGRNKAIDEIINYLKTNERSN